MDTRRIRMLFAALGGMAFLILQVIFPNLPFTNDQIVAFAGLIAVYIVGEGLDAGEVKAGFAALVRSSKFLAVLAGLAVLVAQWIWPDFPISSDLLVKILEALILGAGAQGALTAIRK
jgi:hypothetical protein